MFSPPVDIIGQSYSSFRPEEITCKPEFQSHDVKNFPKKLVIATFHRSCIPPYSSNTSIKEVLLIDIINKGTFYNPAHLHYGNEQTTVCCDVCKTENLKACFGFDKHDICLKCADIITQSK